MENPSSHAHSLKQQILTSSTMCSPEELEGPKVAELLPARDYALKRRVLSLRHKFA